MASPTIGRMTEATLEGLITAVVRRPGTVPQPITFLAKLKNGTPSDADFPRPPPDGVVIVDTSADKIWARTNGAWKSVALT